MSKFNINVEHIPTLSGEVRLTASDIGALLRSLPIVWGSIKLKDSYFYAPAKWDDWRKIISYLQPRVPSYLVDRFDCENNAGWWQSEVARVFRMNTMGDVEGWADVGRGYKERHGWSFFYDPSSGLFFQMEGQTGVIMDADDPLYVPDEIVLR